MASELAVTYFTMLCLEEKTKLNKAKEDYGVAIDPETFEVNKKETERLRG